MLTAGRSISHGGINDVTCHVGVLYISNGCKMLLDKIFKANSYLLKLMKLIATCGLQIVQCVQSKYELFSYIIST